MFDEDFGRFLILLLFGTFIVWVIARFWSNLIEEWCLTRAIALRMEERLALVARGLHPHTLAPLTPPAPGEGPGA